ncbi:hypothetical protein [Martelella endophytica]|uniref:Uncharacterized protein n=1 Tax=Martelella endophytica TaxID=1486262 RepID=A0A0D5LSF2_MAREN|nr:hypothetical protein [Martelella endophytica]AJY47011.1 hypothetical protein TM49_17110 [Martelella endophytica]
MPAALIAMTILGCDDSLSQCRYIDTAPERYATVELCDDALATDLEYYKYSEFPSVVAVCQTPGEPIAEALGGADVQGLPVAVADNGAGSVQQMEPSSQSRVADLADGAVHSVGSLIPSRKQVRTVLTAPVHVVTDSYAWMARKLDR